MTRNDREDVVVFRPARAVHREFIRELSATAFGRFGDYETTLPQLLARPWIHTVLAEAGSRPIGYAMYTFEGTSEGEADLLAIAVLGAWQARGVGRRLLARVEQDVRKRTAPTRAPALRLTVALDNAPARRLFESAGYEYLDGDRGSYPAGQSSIGMRRLLDAPQPPPGTWTTRSSS